MKRVYYLIVATLVLCCIGCTNEPTEGGITITTPTDYSLEVKIAPSQTKVALGNKGENGVYPLYWSEGDKISVNGNLSNEADIDASNPSCARFNFQNVILDYPYNILYPAPTVVLERIPVVGGAQTFSSSADAGTYDESVIFSSQQSYVEGGFESGITPMYGRVTDSNEGIKLNHLSGVLRFGVLSPDNETALASMTITAESGAIAGAFKVDFSNGNLTAQEGASNTLTYSFGEGLQLSTEEAKSFFVVLPCGEFGLCEAVLRLTDGQEMTLKFNTSGNSAIKPGIVREFKEVKFKKGAQYLLTPFESEEDDLTIDDTSYSKSPTTIDGDYLVINDERELLWLFYRGQSVGGVTYNKIRLGADIEMGVFSLLDLPSMNLNDGTEFDGNNKTITGINLGEETSSIFGDAKNLNIHDLTLTDCSANSTLETGVGLLVGMVSDGLTVNNVTFNNCSVVAPRKIGLVAGALHTGTFNISNVTANGGVVETSYLSGVSGLAGGLVGCIAKNGDGATTSTATFTNCTVSTTVKAYMEATNYFYGKIVGQLGGYNGDEKLYFVDCDGSNATLVPLYDQGTKSAETAVLSFCEAHHADFCQTTLTSATDNILGGERYCRGEVYYDGNRFVPEWDGTRAATMITSTEGDITTYYVYSAFDLAKAAGQSYNDAKKLVFKSDVDMGGHTFKPINYVRNLDGENHTVYNVKVERTHDAANNRGAGFIIYASSTSTHKDITLCGFDVTCNHDASIPALEYGNEEDGGAGNGYAGVLVSRAYGTYTASNVHIKDSKVRGVCKVGGLIGTISSGTINLDGCSVDNTTIENYDPKVVNYYKMETKSSGMVIDGLQWWYTAGECGGLVGFVMATTATINNCSVTNCKINCTGQSNKDVVANIWSESAWTAGAYKSGVSIKGNATTTIAGRHVNQFIGDIRSKRTESQEQAGTGEYTTTISDYTVSGNTYNGIAAESTNDYNHNYASGQHCPVVGCAYYTGVDVNILVNIHVSHCAGTLIFNEKGGVATTLTEKSGNGNGMAWFGGNSKNVNIGLFGNNGTSYYPAAPEN